MKFIFKIILLTIFFCSYVFAETYILSSERKMTYNSAIQQKFPFSKSKVSELYHSKPYMSKGRSAIFRTVLNPVSRSKKLLVGMSSIEK